MYGVTEIKSDSGIIKLFKNSEIIFTRNIKKYSIAQNWEILLKKMKKFFLKNKSNIKIFELGIHPFADTFISKDNINKKEPLYPLNCLLDKKSSCIFNEIITPDTKRYNLYDYSYIVKFKLF